MPALGLTGGIATGKSTFGRLFAWELSAEIFDSDQCARELLAGDAAVQEMVRARFGSESFHADGTPDRVALRERVFGDGREAQPDAIEVVAYRLRKKIAGLGVELVALRGVGYLIREKRSE